MTYSPERNIPDPMELSPREVAERKHRELRKIDNGFINDIVLPPELIVLHVLNPLMLHYATGVEIQYDDCELGRRVREHYTEVIEDYLESKI